MPRLSLDQVEALRSQHEPLSTQAAGHVTSDQFKSSANSSKPLGTSLDHRFGDEIRDFAGSELKKAGSKPITGPIARLGSGRPQAELYPWESLTLEVSSPSRTKNVQNGLTNGYHASSISGTIERRGDAMSLGRVLDYSYAAGMQPLVRFVTEHVEIVHDPPYRNWGCAWTCGSTSALEIVLRMFCNRGDAILSERYTYPGLLEAADLLDLRTVGIDMDADGLIPERLEATLSDWNESQSGRRPTVIYMIPSGQNPTGTTQSMGRKQAIYEVAEKFDLVVVEDDPYYFLRLSDAAAEDSTIPAFLESLPPSYLAIDQSGRVIRLDSTSKILAPGLRAGWITASDRIIEKFNLHTEVSTLAVSGPTQLLLWHLLEASWGHAGLFTWLQRLSQTYRARLRTLVQACEQHFPRHLCSYVLPQNGMFLWITLDLDRHPEFCDGGRGSLAKEVEGRIYDRALERGVQITRGSIFDTRKGEGMELIVRLTTAAAEEEEFDAAVRVLGQVLREEFGIDGP